MIETDNIFQQFHPVTKQQNDVCMKYLLAVCFHFVNTAGEGQPTHSPSHSQSNPKILWSVMFVVNSHTQTLFILYYIIYLYLLFSLCCCATSTQSSQQASLFGLMGNHSLRHSLSMPALDLDGMSKHQHLVVEHVHCKRRVSLLAEHITWLQMVLASQQQRDSYQQSRNKPLPSHRGTGFPSGIKQQWIFISISLINANIYSGRSHNCSLSLLKCVIPVFLTYVSSRSVKKAALHYFAVTVSTETASFCQLYVSNMSTGQKY